LFIELKKEGAKIWKKDGSLYASNINHHRQQLEFINEMNSRGYLAKMCIGFDEAKELIDSYMSCLD
jgi:hypothetical protein